MAQSLEPEHSPEPARSPARVWFSRAVDVVLWVAVAGVLLLAFLPKNSGPTVGTRAAAHQLDLVGEAGTRAIPGKLERPLLIEAFASWCGACRRNSGILTDLERARSDGKLDVIAVSVDDSKSAALSAKEEWPIVTDVVHDESGHFARDYKVDVLPTYILIGVDGTIQRVTAGSPGASDIRAWLRASEAVKD
jgi:thiol-disulfide isomerase/thioredoxin